jgi:hypothetical protein
MSKKSKTPSSTTRKRRKHQLGRTSVALTTVMAAGIVLAPNGADAALTTGPDKPAYELATAAGSSTALREILRDYPKSEKAKSAFVQLATLCGSASPEGRDPDCTGSVAADSVSDPPTGDDGGQKRIY